MVFVYCRVILVVPATAECPETTSNEGHGEKTEECNKDDFKRRECVVVVRLRVHRCSRGGRSPNQQRCGGGPHRHSATTAKRDGGFGRRDRRRNLLGRGKRHSFDERDDDGDNCAAAREGHGADVSVDNPKSTRKHHETACPCCKV